MEDEVEGLDEASGGWPEAYSDMSDESDEEDGSSDVGGGNMTEGHTWHAVGDGNSGGTDETEIVGNGSGNSTFIIYFIALRLNHLPKSIPCTLTTCPLIKAPFPFFFHASTRHSRLI
ncbi:hypothetical protein PIB30_030482 [Stylosanthes scabra]|uniref:Uncharacterized protein n=1 Tax=Stylosanthes scabra TaxID=79078 RepID=A0ABU6VDP8_9FABA|nr:hypothetical protein [Stylosanthes scabra]